MGTDKSYEKYSIARSVLLKIFFEKITKSKNIKILFSTSCSDIEENDGVVSLSVATIDTSNYKSENKMKNKNDDNKNKPKNNDNKSENQYEDKSKNKPENEKLKSKTNTDRLTPDLLLGCDGINSGVRTWLSKNEKKKGVRTNKYVPVVVYSPAAGYKFKMLAIKSRYDKDIYSTIQCQYY